MKEAISHTSEREAGPETHNHESIKGWSFVNLPVPF
jgi:hypothetical protein